MGRGWLKNGEYAGSCLIILFSVALRSVVFCIRAEYADVVQVLVAVGWWCEVVSTEHVSSSVYAGVAEAGLGVIVITELSHKAIAPWGSFRISWGQWSEVVVIWLRCR